MSRCTGIVAAVVLLGMFSTACQSPQRVTEDAIAVNDIPAVAPPLNVQQQPQVKVIWEREQEDEGLLALLWPPNWFDEDQPQPARPRIVVTGVDQEDDDGLLSLLWPPNWFEEDEPWYQEQFTPVDPEEAVAQALEDADIDPITADEITENMSPELVTLAEREDEIDMTIARTLDLNLRQMLEDVMAVLLLDDPVHLNTKPIP